MLSILAAPHPLLFGICSKFVLFMEKEMIKSCLLIPQAFKDIITTIGRDSLCFYNFILGRESKLPCYLQFLLIGEFKMNSVDNTKMKRGERVLTNVSSKMGLTPEAKAWLTASLDPFHDGQIPNLEGYPDTLTSPSVVQVVKKSLQISKPSTMASGNWSFQVHFYDSLGASEACAVGINQNIVFADVTNNTNSTPRMYTGGIGITAHLDSDTNPMWMFSNDGTKGTPIRNIATDPAYLRGRCRVIGRAFELRNTTAEIYKQGSVCVYRQPTAPEEFAAYETRFAHNGLSQEQSEKNKYKKPTIGAVSAAGWRDLRLGTPPPDGLADAMLLAGTRQWESKHGCYIVQTQYDMENPASYFAPRGNLILIDEGSFGFPSAAVPYQVNDPQAFSEMPNGFDDSWSAYLESDPCIIYTPTFLDQKFIPYNPCGAIVSGLGNESTFTLNWIEIFERTVTSEQLDLVVMAKPSPCISYPALELYSAVWRELAVGVPVEENGLGDWFLSVCDSIADTVSDIARPILGALGGYQQARKPNPPPQPKPPQQVANPQNSWTQPTVQKVPKVKKNGEVKVKKNGKVKMVNPNKQPKKR